MSQQILDLLAKSSAQKPMQFNTLLDETGLLPKTLNMILNSMYASRSINQATVTRNGVEQREVWLTGVVEKAERQHIVINKAYTPPSGHQTMPRRDEKPVIKPVEEPPVIAAPPAEIKTEKVIDMNTEAKPKALLMLEHIELYGEIMIKQLQHYLKDKTIGESFIRGYIDDKRVIVSINSIGKKSYSLAPGMKVKDFYVTRAVKQKSAVEAEYVSPMKKIADALADGTFHEKHQAEKVQLSDIAHPEQNAKPDAPALPNKIDIDAAYQSIPSAAKRKFRIAVTNDRTLMLFGLGFETIELDVEETEMLVDFCDAVSMSLPFSAADQHTVGGKQL